MRTNPIVPAFLLTLLCVSALRAQGGSQTWVSPCTLDVVLVTFADATTRGNDQYDFYNYDRPYGTNPGQNSRDRYTRQDFERLFSGGYDNLPAFAGTNQTVANGRHALPEVFGSLRAYLDAVSSGAFVLHVRLINPADGDYPRWVELPQSKGHYGGINHNDAMLSDLFWNHAQVAAQDSVDRWYPDTNEYDIPDNSYSRDRRLRHKVLYLYSGAIYSHRMPPSLIHPQVDRTTSSNPAMASQAGYRYVMGEREGWGDDSDMHSVDEFAGIGTHVHEFGHLLGFSHPDGEWDGTNPYTSQTTGDPYTSGPQTEMVEFGGANLSGWGSMQSGAHGPPKVSDNGYHAGFRSCPNPFNPFYRMDVGWNTRNDITMTTLDQRIEPGPEHFYVIRGASGQTFILEFRTASGFGQYSGWYRFTASPGLLLWRRWNTFGPFGFPTLIPADGRSIFDARGRPVRAEPSTEDPTYTYVWQDRLSDPYGAVEQNGPFGSLPVSEHRPSVTQATDATHLSYNLGSNLLPPSRVAFRNVRIHRGAAGGEYAEVDIYVNYWAGVLEGRETWSGVVYVGGDVTIPAGAQLTIRQGTEVRFLADTDDETGGGNDPERSALIVEGTLDADAGGITFRSTNEPPNATDNDWYGIRVEDGGTVHLSGATIRDGYRCVQAHAMDTPDMTNATLDNCGVTVNLSPSVPVVGQLLTAVLEGTEGSVADEQWRWQWRTSADQIAWANLAPAASGQTTSYLPEIIDFDRMLRATVWYRNAANTYDYAQSAPTAGVVPTTPAKPAGFEVLSLDGAVLLRWEDLNDPSITHWQYGVQRGSDPYVWVSLPAADALHNRAGRGEPGSGAGMIEYRIPQLENGVAYRFKLRAENSAGLGAETDALGATPGAVPSKPTAGLSATSGTNNIEVGWDAVSATPEVIRYKLQYQSSVVGTEAWSALVDLSTPGRRKRNYTHREDGTVTVKYRFRYRLQARNAIGEGAWSDTFPAAGAIPLPGQSPGLVSMDLDDQEVTMTWVCPNSPWCDPLSGSSVPPLRLESRVKSGSAAWTSWQGVTSSQTTTVRQAVSGLDQSMAHQFQTRGVNADGQPGMESEKAVVVPLRAQAEDGEVRLQWGGPRRSVDVWQYRSKAAGKGAWGAWREAGSRTARSYTVSSLRNGTSYQFQVRAVSRRTQVKVVSFIGSATPNPPLSPPLPPAELTASAGNEQVRLSWDNSGNAAIDSLQYRHKSAGQTLFGAWGTIPVPIGASAVAVDEHTVTGLTNGIRYFFEVRARNEAGWSGPSNQASATPAGAPEAPGNLQASAGDAQVALSWETPLANGATITGYDYRQSTDGGAAWSPDWSSIEGSGPTTRRHTVVGLTNEVEYTLEVRAVNAVGAGDSSRVQATPRGEVRRLELSAERGDGEMVLSWVYTGSEAVTGWQYRQSTNGGSSWSGWTSVPGGGLARSYTAGSLTNGVAYTFQVQGLTAVDHVESNAVTATPAGAPEAPGNLQASAGDAQVALSWETPLANGAAITGYEVRSSSNGGMVWSPDWSSIEGSGPTTRSHTVVGLTNEVEYTLEVRAVNAVGAGDSSRVQATPNPPLRPPLPPAELTAFAGNEQVRLSWDNSGNAAIDSLQYRHKSADETLFGAWGTIPVPPGVSAVAVDEYTVPGLTNGIRYFFEVRARNEAGWSGPSNQASATPYGLPPPPDLTATGGHATVALSWAYASNVPVTRWQWRQQGAERWTDLDAGGRSHEVVDLDDGTRYTFELRGTNDHGAGLADVASATTLPRARLSARRGNGRVTLDWHVSVNLLYDWEYHRSTNEGATWGNWTSMPHAGVKRTYTVRGLSNGTPYAFEIRALNSAGAGGPVSNAASATPAGVPGRPGSLSASAGNAQVTLSWETPDDNGSAIVRYEYRQSTNGGTSWASPGWKTMEGSVAATTSHEVVDLDNGTRYTFEVRAVNDVGSGDEARVSAAPYGLPPPPDLTATGGHATVTLSWAYASNVPVTRWQWRQQGAERWTDLDAGGRSHEVVDLDNGTRYTFELRGTNDHGAGLADVASATTLPRARLSAYRGDGRATLSWSVTSHVVYDWEYRRSTNGGVTWSGWASMPYAGVKRSYEVRGLTNGTTYTFQIRALNSAGAAGPLSNAETVTPAGRPGRPENLRASAGDRRVALSWAAAASNGADITAYGVRWRGGGAWSGWTTLGSTARSHTLGSLTNGVDHTFEVRAENEVGWGTAASVSARPEEPLPPAARLSAYRGDGRATLSWSVTSHVVYDWEYRRSTNGGSSWSGWTSMPYAGVKRSYEVRGLTNGVAYTFQIRALNSAGAAGPLSNRETVTPAGRPGRPENLRASAGDRRVALSWAAAAANGADITAYGVRWRGGGAWSGWATLGSSARSHTLGSLTNGVEHTFEVRATNEVGWGTAASVSARPEEPLPAKPTGLSATGGDSRVSLRWDNPHNSTITEWQYRRKAGSGSWGSSRTISGSGAGTTSYAVTGLLDLTRYTFQVRAKNAAGEGPWSDEASAQTTLPFRRSSNHPNPFNAETLLRYAVPEAQRVRLTIYDMLGRAVRELVHEVRPAGVHEVVWDGRDGEGRPLASGIYLYRLVTAESSHTRKMILLR